MNTIDIRLKFHEDLSKQYPSLLKKLKAISDEASVIDLNVLSKGLRNRFVDTHENLQTFFSSIVTDEYSSLDTAKEKSVANLEEAISEQTDAIRRTYERLTGEPADMTSEKAPMVWERSKVEEQLSGKTSPDSPISPRLDDARRLYQNITDWQDRHAPTSDASENVLYAEMETLRAAVFDFIREMDNTLSGAELGLTKEQSAYWRWANMDGSYTGGTAESAAGSEASLSYDELVNAIKELEQDLKQTSPTDLSGIGEKSALLEMLNQRRYMMGAMLHLDGEPNAVQTQINKKRKLIDGLYTTQDQPDEQSRLKSELKAAKAQLYNAPTVEAKLSVSAKISELQNQIDEATKGKLSIEAEAAPTYIVQGSTADKRQSYSNAQHRAMRIQEDFDIGLTGKDEALREIDELNKKLKSLGAGLKPIKLELDSKAFAKGMSTNLKDFRSVQSALQSVMAITDPTAKGFAAAGESATALGGCLQQLGADSEAAKAGLVLAAIGNIVLSFAQALTSCKTWVEWLAFGIAGTAQMISMVSTISGFATGGIVGGTQKNGDKVLVRVNSGEMILNAAQQARLFAIANGASLYGQTAAVANDFSTGSALQGIVVNTQGLQSIGTDAAQRQHKSVSLRLRGRDLVGSLANETRSNRKRSNIRIG